MLENHVGDHVVGSDRPVFEFIVLDLVWRIAVQDSLPVEDTLYLESADLERVGIGTLRCCRRCTGRRVADNVVIFYPDLSQAA